MADIWLDCDVSLSEVPVNLIPLVDDTDFKTVEDAVAYNAGGMDLRWNFVTTGGSFTSTAVTPTSGGSYDWTHQGDGIYTIEIPASGGASINNDTEGFGWFSGKATGVLPWRGPVIGFRAAAINDALIDGGDLLDTNVTQFGGTNGTFSGGRPEVNASHWGGTAVGSATVNANMTQISGDSTAADNLEAAADGTGYNLGGGQVVAASVTDKTGFALTAAYDAAKTAASQASVDVIDGIVDAILEDTGTTIPATLATIDTNVDSILTDTGTDIPTSIAGIDADVQNLLTNLATADGKLDSILEDTGTTLPATLSALQTSVTTIDDLLDTEVSAIKSVVDAILVDTAEIGAAGAGLTAVPWNASWDAEVQSEVSDALNAYDPPTNAEMEARTLTAASYATPTNITSASGVTLTSAYDFAKGTVAMTESYNADGSAPTPAQALFVIMQTLTEGAISGTTWTIKKLDGSTTALTITLNDASTPTSKTRAS